MIATAMANSCISLRESRAIRHHLAVERIPASRGVLQLSRYHTTRLAGILSAYLVHPRPPHRGQKYRKPSAARGVISSGISRVPLQSEQTSPPSGIGGSASTNSGRPTALAHLTIHDATSFGSSRTWGN